MDLNNNTGGQDQTDNAAAMREKAWRKGNDYGYDYCSFWIAMTLLFLSLIFFRNLADPNSLTFKGADLLDCEQQLRLDYIYILN